MYCNDILDQTERHPSHQTAVEGPYKTSSVFSLYILRYTTWCIYYTKELHSVSSLGRRPECLTSFLRRLKALSSYSDRMSFHFFHKKIDD